MPRARRNSDDALADYREMPIIELAETASLATRILKERFDEDVEIVEGSDDIAVDLQIADEILNDVYDSLEEG